MKIKYSSETKHIISDWLPGKLGKKKKKESIKQIYTCFGG
jgi:hypothetical protein